MIFVYDIFDNTDGCRAIRFPDAAAEAAGSYRFLTAAIGGGTEE